MPLQGCRLRSLSVLTGSSRGRTSVSYLRDHHLSVREKWSDRHQRPDHRVTLMQGEAILAAQAGGAQCLELFGPFTEHVGLGDQFVPFGAGIREIGLHPQQDVLIG